MKNLLADLQQATRRITERRLQQAQAREQAKHGGEYKTP